MAVLAVVMAMELVQLVVWWWLAWRGIVMKLGSLPSRTLAFAAC